MGESLPKAEALLRMRTWLEAGRRLKVRETAAKLGVDRRTIQRYVAALERQGLALDFVELDNRERAYFLPFAASKLKLDIKEPQVVALNVALGWLDQFEGNVLFESLSTLREKLAEWLEAHTEAEGQRWFAQKFFALPFLPYRYRSSGAAFNDVVSALLRQHKLEFSYRPASAGAGDRPKRHKVRPYTLVFYKGAFYLLAIQDWLADWGDPSRFSLARMTNTRVLRSEPYDYPDGWKPADAFHLMTGMLPGDVVTVKARFAGFYDYLKNERRWPRGTKIQRDGDHVLFSARLAANDELLNWFLGFGPAVEILAPAEFRDKLAKKARDTAAVYRRSAKRKK